MKEIVSKLNDLLSRWDQRETQLERWFNGKPTGGPQKDGRYPITDSSGDTSLVSCPAAVADVVQGPAAKAEKAASTAASIKQEAEVVFNEVKTLRDEIESVKEQTKQSSRIAEDAQAECANNEDNVIRRVRQHFPKAEQLRIPSRTTKDAVSKSLNGVIGWDNDYLYLKTERGTKKIPLEDV